MRVAVTGRKPDQAQAIAAEIGGLALVGDVSRREHVEDWVERVESELGPIALLVVNAGISQGHEDIWEVEPETWWRVHEVNVLGVFLSCRAVIPAMLERGSGRIVVVASGAAYLPGAKSTAYTSSKAAVHRFAETLANQLAGRIAVFSISPGLVRTALTEGSFPDDAPWTPPELAPRLVRVLASGRADALAGRYLHAEHDEIEALIARADEIVEEDLNAIRLQR
jgi:NAD(P)-dependent dehydrogenase (short-subunit alcohol dehydrogenase family)